MLSQIATGISGVAAINRCVYSSFGASHTCSHSPNSTNRPRFMTATRSQRYLTSGIECGMLSINHLGFGIPELPFGGVKDSGYGTEGGSEGIEAYFTTKLVTQTS